MLNVINEKKQGTELGYNGLNYVQKKKSKNTWKELSKIS